MAEHLPFSEWITAGETLSAEDERRLQAHLAGCGECRNLAARWAGAAALLADAKEREPRAGFAGRWKALAAAREAAPKARQAWLFVAASGLGALLLALGLIGQNVAQGGSFEGCIFRHAGRPLDLGWCLGRLGQYFRPNRRLDLPCAFSARLAGKSFSWSG